MFYKLKYINKTEINSLIDYESLEGFANFEFINLNLISSFTDLLLVPNYSGFQYKYAVIKMNNNEKFYINESIYNKLFAAINSLIQII